MDKKTLIEHLNHDLEGEMGAVIHYTLYAKTVKGPYYEDVAEMFDKLAMVEFEHMKELADQIVLLGGTPSTTPRPMKLLRRLDELVKYNLEQEEIAIEDYKKRIKEAEQLGEVGVRLMIEHIIAEEYQHFLSFKRLLGK
ncbi:MAG: hypothetical protein RBG1_1C00001G1064 [candidate division Zixibacteria bacterium RBG-1]|nr:MAG: hypothetical protein RBG1_1C00001G1064 [candidate division Zixibacteria bacterium RBG-1]OGC85690.1 MAG: hypothetical protein A2V73_01250 [candidate division Zixibacteria bacterium RBG_19FT_COMBO_42_43]